MNAPTPLARSKPPLVRVAEAFMALTLTVMVVCVFTNAVLRYTLGTGIVIAEELSRLLFVWLVAVGAIIAAFENQHLGLDLLTSRLGQVGRKACAVIAQAVGFGVLCVLVWGSWQQVVVGVKAFSPVMKYPQALAAASTLVMSVAMLIIMMWQWFASAPAPTQEAAIE